MIQAQEIIKEKRLVGLVVHTSYQQELTHQTSNIAVLVERYQQEGIPGMIPHRKNPGVTISAYTEYETDYRGNYVFFIGEEVSAFDSLPHGLSPLIIPEGIYTKFTTHPGAIPGIIIDAWQKIWQMSDAELGGKRHYHTDFQVCDERAKDEAHAIMDIYVGIIPTMHY